MSKLEKAPNGKLMVIPLCEYCGSRTIPVDSIVHGKYRECWAAYHGYFPDLNPENCPGTDKFKNSPYEDVKFVEE